MRFARAILVVSSVLFGVAFTRTIIWASEDPVLATSAAEELPSAQVLRERIRELEAQVRDLQLQARLRSAELAVARGQLKAREKRDRK